MLGLTLMAMTAMASQTSPADLSIRGLHFAAPRPDEIGLCTKFIREVLPKEGVNTLVVEIDYRFRFVKHPEIADDDPLSKEQVKEIVQACRDAKVRLIPQINLLGHQSWDKYTGSLLRKHPEFDETPGKYPDNKGIYCRSYCPLHPGVHDVVFDLLDEVADAFEADAVHVGMDEVFILADPDCPRCKGKPTAELFAGEVKRLHDHLASKKREMWMWGDRFIDGSTNGLGEWEASTNKTHTAIDSVPKDIVICDWHYEKAEPTPAYFAVNGFNVVASPWRQSQVALGQLDLIRSIKKGANSKLSGHLQGVLHTTWCGSGPFIRAYNGDTSVSKEAQETAQCFKDLFKAVRG